MSAINILTGVIGSAMIATFLLYYVIVVGSVPLSIIMVAILIMVGRTLYDELRHRRNDRQS